MTNITTFLDGDSWCATFDDFANLQESLAGFGSTPENAIDSLLKAALEKANEILQEIKPEQEYANGLITKVKGAILESKTSFSCDIAEISYKNAYQKEGYDTKALDKQIEKYPWLNDFKKVTMYKETAAIKWV